MTAELGDWLTELGQSEPATATVVAGSLVAVLVSADPSGLAIVRQPGRPAEDFTVDPRAAVDVAYQQLLEDLQRVRRSIADVASTRHRAEVQLGLHRESGADASEIGIAQAQLADARRREEQLTERSQRLQDQINAYRAVKESAKALYTATEAQLRVTEALETGGSDGDAELAKLRDELQASAARLLKLAGQTASPRDGAEPAPGMLELHADPLGSGIRILLAVEPADTVTLLAVLEGPEAVSEHGAEAMSLASDLLTEIRENGWPADVDEVIVENSAAFLARFTTAAS